jgi:hypothetical protein
MLAGERGGEGHGAEKAATKRKVPMGLLQYIPCTLYFVLVNKKCAK